MNSRDQAGDSSTMRVNCGWGTNAVMAGMFSMLNNSHLRLDNGASGSSFGAWDDNSPGRMTPNRTPLPSRRNPGFGRDSFSPISTQHPRRDRLPRHLRRKRFEIHPILRRSVCTLFLAILLVLIGAALILVDQLALQHTMSQRGYSVLGVGLVLAIVGCLWFGYSRKRLHVFLQRLEEAKSVKIKEKQALSDMRLRNGSTIITRACSTQWPKTRAPPSRPFSKFQFSITSPNGRMAALHADSIDTFSTGEEEDDDASCAQKQVTLEIPCSVKRNGPSARPKVTKTRSLDHRALESNYNAKRAQRDSAYSEISCQTDPTPHRVVSSGVVHSASCDSLQEV